MKYLVMESRPSYAVVLDEEGRFLKVANLGYQVGQRVDTVIGFQEETSSPARKWVPLVSLAACLCLITLAAFQLVFSSIGTVRMQINPDVLLSVNRYNYVVSAEGLNEDGWKLVDGYQAFWKKVEVVSDELADRAMEMGFLEEGGEITLTVDSEDEGWKTATEEMLLLELDVHFESTVKVQANHDSQQVANGEEDHTVVIRPEDIVSQPDDSNNSSSSSSQSSSSSRPNPSSRPGSSSRPGDDDDDDDDGDDDDDQPSVSRPAGDDDDDNDDNDDGDDDDDQKPSAGSSAVSRPDDDDDDDNERPAGTGGTSRPAENDDDDDDDRDDDSGDDGDNDHDDDDE